MQIIVNTPEKTIGLSVWLSDSINDVKDKIHEMVGIPPDQQRLIFNDKQLEHGRMLDHGVQEGAELEVGLVGSASGGGSGCGGSGASGSGLVR